MGTMHIMHVNETDFKICIERLKRLWFAIHWFGPFDNNFHSAHKLEFDVQMTAAIVIVNKHNRMLLAGGLVDWARQQ